MSATLRIYGGCQLTKPASLAIHVAGCGTARSGPVVVWQCLLCPVAATAAVARDGAQAASQRGGARAGCGWWPCGSGRLRTTAACTAAWGACASCPRCCAALAWSAPPTSVETIRALTACHVVCPCTGLINLCVDKAPVVYTRGVSRACSACECAYERTHTHTGSVSLSGCIAKLLRALPAQEAAWRDVARASRGGEDGKDSNEDGTRPKRCAPPMLHRSRWRLAGCACCSPQ